jgi:hypothetical protein
LTALASAHSAAFAGAGPEWLRPVFERLRAACRALAEADDGAESVWRFGELLLAAEEAQVMTHAWLAEQALGGSLEVR